MAKRRSKAGFTMAELLVVVAIIAVLVAIAIPVFNNQLEKSREATDLANVRAAYAEVMAAAINEDSAATYNDATIKNGDVYSAYVPLKQKPGWVMERSEISLAGCTYSNGGMIGEPGSWCKIQYHPNVGEGLRSLIIDWSVAFRFPEMGKREEARAWNGDGSIDLNGNSAKRMSTQRLVQLEPNTKYTVTFTLPDGYSGDYKIQMGTLLFLEGNGTSNVQNDKWTASDGIEYRADSRWLTGSGQVGSASNKRVTYTIYTDSTHTYFGANFKVLNSRNSDMDLRNPESDQYKFAESVLKTLEVARQ